MSAPERIAAPVGRAFVVVIVAGLSAGPAIAQEIDRDAYLAQLPLGQPRLVPQTPASAALHLFGDPTAPGYVDLDPVDGIDDRRHAVLLELAMRFAPYLVQNTRDLPVNFTVYIENRESFPLHIDTWDLTGGGLRRIAYAGVNFSVLGRAACDPALRNRAFETSPEPTTEPALEDCKLLQLMDRFTPGTSAVRPVDESLVRPTPDRTDVLFFDFPGDGPKTWAEAYVPEYERTAPERRASFAQSLVHPFLREVEGRDGTAGYEVVLQYWFFYPSNDSGMDHEGDWEHLNVVVSPRSMVEGPLSASTVQGILSGEIPAGGDAPDPLVIKRLDYYFHNSVMPLDFSSPNVYLPRDEWEAARREHEELRFRERQIWDRIRYMAYADDDETVINTHPLGYIGSNNKGLNQALELPGPRNQDAHGTYPITGRYNNVGPGGTTDELSHNADVREVLRDLADGSIDQGPAFRSGAVVGFADPDRLRIVPDWERVVGLAREDHAVRADWAWMFLPIKWGYPATTSPFSGVIEHYNTGNNSPPGPTFQGGWNASGAAPGISLYDPHTLPDLLPLQIQDNFRNDLGFLNLTVPLLLNLPPLDFIVRLAIYPFRVLFNRREPVFYPNESVPFRFVGISSGVSYQRLHEDFNALAVNPDQFERFRFGLFGHLIASGADSTTQVLAAEESVSSSFGTFIQLPFYVGSRFTSENTVRNVRSAIHVKADFSNIPAYTYDAEINYWEYAGSIRYSFLTSRFQPYVKVGYGWAWYRLENVVDAVGAFEPANSGWIGPKNVLPNVLHGGFGIEFLPRLRVGLGGLGMDVAVRLEYARYSQSLGLDLDAIPLADLSTLFTSLADVPNAERVARNDFVFGVSLTF